MAARIDKVVTSGTFSLDGGTWDVDNNVWIIGDDLQVIIIDPAHDVDAIAETVGDREVMGILLTHGHDDHIRAVTEAQDRFSAPVFLHEADRMLWDAVFPDEAPDDVIEDGDTFEIAGVTLEALHTPGHSPGSVCFLLEDEEGSIPVLFSGDTLFSGGPGATGRSYSDFGTIIDSIRERLLTLPAETTVNTGHGDSTTIGAEAPHLDEWIARGH
ncbi:MBL fold metallo-hydrolase [Arthrobacter gandavensis]|uniref:MBL fold metallo-hydrolase n=1 Tax=Arthrobacter gandavensis TaxID=169960 RepID=UPI00188FA0C5|nr:MBL fold metallo-hydrolase [Arthrobacter gandavensis]MBF4995357.1 MBL fold metallo-hydrolase [Arthrobacter gandavensis]